MDAEYIKVAQSLFSVIKCNGFSSFCKWALFKGCCYFFAMDTQLKHYRHIHLIPVPRLHRLNLSGYFVYSIPQLQIAAFRFSVLPQLLVDSLRLHIIFRHTLIFQLFVVFSLA